MATLKIHLPGQGAKVYRIHKKLTSLGRGEDADVNLPDASLSDSPAHIHFDGREFNLSATDRDAEIFVNGRKKAKQKLAHDDRIRIGSVELEFSLYDQPSADEAASGGEATELASFK
jgi:predicted component of type VI protein secretion system